MGHVQWHKISIHPLLGILEVHWAGSVCNNVYIYIHIVTYTVQMKCAKNSDHGFTYPIHFVCSIQTVFPWFSDHKPTQMTPCWKVTSTASFEATLVAATGTGGDWRQLMYRVCWWVSKPWLGRSMALDFLLSAWGGMKIRVHGSGHVEVQFMQRYTGWGG